MKTKLHVCYKCVGAQVCPMHALCLVVQSLGRYGPRLFDSLCFLLVSLTSLAPSALPSHFVLFCFDASNSSVYKQVLNKTQRCSPWSQGCRFPVFHSVLLSNWKFSQLPLVWYSPCHVVPIDAAVFTKWQDSRHCVIFLLSCCRTCVTCNTTFVKLSEAFSL